MDWVVATALLVLGQLVLIALGPLSRVGDPGAGTSGPYGLALLAPDSVGYLADAVSWETVVGEPWPRWGYLAVLRVGQLLGGAAPVAVLVQVAASIAAGVLLIRLGRDLAGPVAGTVAAAVLLVNPMTAQWVRFVLTEALFYALAVAVTVQAARWLAHDRPGPGGGRLVVLALLAVTLRPTGPLLAGSALALLALGLGRTRRRRIAGVALAVLTTAGLLLAANSVTTPAEATLAEQLRNGVVVEGTPDVRTTIPMPDDPALDVPAYVAAHPVATARLLATRVIVEIAQVRRHYPPVVNVVLAVAVLVLTGLAAIGLADRRGRTLLGPTAIVLLPLVAIVGVTFAVPEGRYGWAGLVALAPAAGVGAAAALDRVRRQPGDPAAR